MTCVGCLVLLLIVCLFGIRLRETERTLSSDNAEKQVSITNPIRESSAEEIYAKLNIRFYIPIYEGWIFGGDLEN